MSIYETNSEQFNRIARALAAIASSILMVGIFGCKEDSDAQVEGKVVIKGSDTFGEELAPQLIVEYRKKHTNVVFDLEFKGTASGFAALLANECDIVAASRLPNEDEMREARHRDIKMNDYVVCHDGVTVIVNASNPVRNLTRDQVRDIFTGAIQNWKVVGGADAPIRVYVRNRLSGTYAGFSELAMENKPYVQSAQSFTSYKYLTDAIIQDGNGIGYSSMVLATPAEVRAVSIGGMPANSVSVNEVEYPYVQTLRLHTIKAKETPQTRDFIHFVQSSRGQTIVEQTGFVRHLKPPLRGYIPED